METRKDERRDAEPDEPMLARREEKSYVFVSWHHLPAAPHNPVTGQNRETDYGREFHCAAQCGCPADLLIEVLHAVHELRIA